MPRRRDKDNDVSDETPATPGPSAEEPVTAAPVEEPTEATVPPADAPSPQTPQTPGTPAAPEVPATPATPAAAAADDTPTVPSVAPSPPADEAPTQVAVTPDVPAEAGAAPAAVAAAPVASAPSERHRGVFVPVWVAAAVGVLVVAGLGFLIGWIAAPGDDSSPTNAAATAPNGQQVPTFPGGGQDAPTFPGNGTNGNGNGSSNGGSSDDDSSSTVPSPNGAFMGVSVESATDGGTGARVSSVQADSPAAKAGLKEGDVITEIDGDEVTSSLDVVRAVRSAEPGDTLTVTYTRNGSTSEATVTLGSTSSSRSAS